MMVGNSFFFNDRQAASKSMRIYPNSDHEQERKDKELSFRELDIPIGSNQETDLALNLVVHTGTTGKHTISLEEGLNQVKEYGRLDSEDHQGHKGIRTGNGSNWNFDSGANDSLGKSYYPELASADGQFNVGEYEDGEEEEAFWASGPASSIDIELGYSENETCDGIEEQSVVDYEYRCSGVDDDAFSIKSFDVRQEDDYESWEEEYFAYLNHTLNFQAMLQYQVRAVLIAPMFESRGRKLSSFSDVYLRKFGRHFETTGFSSVARLCKAMPHVVQGDLLEEGKLLLVDSKGNYRAVAGIRSGLRRVVFDVLKTSEDDISTDELEKRCTCMIGESLQEVLSEHGYGVPCVDWMIRDMLDLVHVEEVVDHIMVSLCHGAEDPALTDGLLIRRAEMNTCTSSMPTLTPNITKEMLGMIKNKYYEGSKTDDQHSAWLQNGNSISFNPGLVFQGSETSKALSAPIEVDILHAKFLFRVLLAFYNSGQGVEIGTLSRVFETIFSKPLRLQQLGCKSIHQLVRNWQDIFLVPENTPNVLFLVPSATNRRSLNTLLNGLRFTVFSVLLDSYPDGLTFLDFLKSLHLSFSGKLAQVLGSSGYEVSNPLKTGSFLSWGPDLQVAEFGEICVLLDDMVDFVRFGSTEAGTLLVRLQNGEFPLLDIVGCRMDHLNLPVCAKFGNHDSGDVDMIKKSDSSTADNGSCQAELDRFTSAETPAMVHGGENQNMIGDGQDQHMIPAMVHGGENQNMIGDGQDQHMIAPKIAKRATTFSTFTLDNRQHPQRLKHEFRLILGSPEYFARGIPWNDIRTVYKGRTGRHLVLQPSKTLKEVIFSMPDIVCRESVLRKQICLARTPKNIRIISATMAGLRQVLYWALLKNPGGVNANVLEGWCTDLIGSSLANALHKIGYEMGCTQLFPICTFMKDMSDLLCNEDGRMIYTWSGGGSRDPSYADAELLALPLESVEYDPLPETQDMEQNKALDLNMENFQTATMDDRVQTRNPDLSPKVVKRATESEIIQTNEVPWSTEKLQAASKDGVKAQSEVLLSIIREKPDSEHNFELKSKVKPVTEDYTDVTLEYAHKEQAATTAEADYYPVDEPTPHFNDNNAEHLDTAEDLPIVTEVYAKLRCPATDPGTDAVDFYLSSSDLDYESSDDTGQRSLSDTSEYEDSGTEQEIPSHDDHFDTNELEEPARVWVLPRVTPDPVQIWL